MSKFTPGPWRAYVEVIAKLQTIRQEQVHWQREHWNKIQFLEGS